MSQKQAYGGQRWARESSLFSSCPGRLQWDCLPHALPIFALGLSVRAPLHFYLVDAQ